MLVESQGKLEKSQGKVGEFCVKNLADTLYDYIWPIKILIQVQLRMMIFGMALLLSH